MNKELYNYILSIADNCLILGQRLGELCGHGPTLETDIALTNISLDLFGQVRSYYQYAAKLVDDKTTEDDIAFLRNEREYVNALLVEQPNTDFAFIMGRQFLFDAFHLMLLSELQKSHDVTLAAIASKSIKEVSYHYRFSSDWVRRLGDGTPESKERMQAAINDLWAYTEELFYQTASEKLLIEKGIALDLSQLKASYYQNITDVLEESTLTIPDSKWFKKGGKEGIHSEHMGYILSDMQFMQRAYPNMKW
ncbi:MAG: phenylacetate-CoA oxygenase subunit PaaC [Bacteroidia bacterium]|nr:phenylacetate-CoA oxygenase subunit PaaC [Bacteroidia bacterium]